MPQSRDMIYIGMSTNEEEAARMYDREAIKIGKPLNFPQVGVEQGYRCEVCDETFRTHQGYSRHFEAQGKESCYENKEARKKKFAEQAEKRKEALQYGEKAFKNPEKYKCDECGVGYGMKRALREHVDLTKHAHAWPVIIPRPRDYRAERKKYVRKPYVRPMIERDVPVSYTPSPCTSDEDDGGEIRRAAKTARISEGARAWMHPADIALAQPMSSSEDEQEAEEMPFPDGGAASKLEERNDAKIAKAISKRRQRSGAELGEASAHQNSPVLTAALGVIWEAAGSPVHDATSVLGTGTQKDSSKGEANTKKRPKKAAESSPKKRPKNAAEKGPKRPMTAYLFWSSDIRDEFKKEHPDLNFVEMSKYLGKAWKLLSPEDKAPYEELHKKDKIRYEDEKSLLGAVEESEAAKSKAGKPKSPKPAVKSKSPRTVKSKPTTTSSSSVASVSKTSSRGTRQSSRRSALSILLEAAGAARQAQQAEQDEGCEGGAGQEGEVAKEAAEGDVTEVVEEEKKKSMSDDVEKGKVHVVVIEKDLKENADDDDEDEDEDEDDDDNDVVIEEGMSVDKGMPVEKRKSWRREIQEDEDDEEDIESPSLLEAMSQGLPWTQQETGDMAASPYGTQDAQRSDESDDDGSDGDGA